MSSRNHGVIGIRHRWLRSVALALLISTAAGASAQSIAPDAESLQPMSSDPAHTAPAYPVPYGRPTEVSVKAVMDHVLDYSERVTPIGLTTANGQPLPRNARDLPVDARFLPGLRMTSYEWGVTYSGALLAGRATQDARYTRYAATRLAFITAVAAAYRRQGTPAAQTPVRNMLAPGSLDDSGSLAAAIIKAERAGLLTADARPQIDIFLDWITRHQSRLPDGTLDRDRPLPNSLWLDDLYMSVPALAQMGALTGERRYYDDAVRQILHFSQRMFDPDKGLYQHGWVQDMSPHPAFFWGRPNGWAIMAMTELLDVLPADHPGRPAVLKQLKALIAGLAKTQSDTGLWHQLLDRPETYPETSASAIFAFAIAHAINQGWIDGRVYAPMAFLAWNGVTTKVSAIGEVTDVSVGTGMAFDPAFYAYRPRSVSAAHGYGPVLLAGAEIRTLLRNTAVTPQAPSDGYIWQPRTTEPPAPRP